MAREKVRRYWSRLLFILPALSMFGFVILIPAVGGVALSFFQWSGMGWSGDAAPKFVGLENYRRILTQDDIFVSAFKHNVVYMLSTLVVEVAVGLALALLLDMISRGRDFFRVLLFVPMMLSLTVIGMMWRFIFHPETGALPGLLSDERTALLTICAISGWTYCGFYMILFQAGLQRIPQDLYDAARIDGTGEFGRMLHVSIPLLRNTIWVSALLCVTGAFKSYDLFWVMTGGGPLHATEVVSTHLVQIAFTNHELGRGSAMAAIMSVLVLALSLAYAWFGRKRQGDEY
ncbi:MAG TPA: sugar ABC transporter permease [Candidatus Brocadiia bacterium]|nr:sugar ABC transporter permease [Candidatus Brocadiia bacterium]